MTEKQTNPTLLVVIEESQNSGHYGILLNNTWYEVFIDIFKNSTTDIRIRKLCDSPRYIVDLLVKLLLKPKTSSHLSYIIKNKDFYNIVSRLFPDLDSLYEIYYVRKDEDYE